MVILKPSFKLFQVAMLERISILSQQSIFNQTFNQLELINKLELTLYWMRSNSLRRDKCRCKSLGKFSTQSK